MDISELKKDHRTSYLAGALEKLLLEEAEVREMLEGDASLEEMARKELRLIQERKEEIEKQIKEILDKPARRGGDKEEEEFPSEIVLEVRAGAGGDEASLFAWELARMYEKFAEKRGWQWKVDYESKNEVNGYKEASFEVKGKDVYKLLRYETGVNRVQRIPATGQNGHKGETGVPLLHKPAGLDAPTTNRRRQPANRGKALLILKAKLQQLR